VETETSVWTASPRPKYETESSGIWSRTVKQIKVTFTLATIQNVSLDSSYLKNI
jgi:hypothetical protein